MFPPCPKTSYCRIGIWLIVGCILLVVVLVLVVLAIFGSHPCASATCDAFTAICGSYNGDHQFFYSQCDMLRENCLTGSDWQQDHFNHCNVNA